MIAILSSSNLLHISHSLAMISRLKGSELIESSFPNRSRTGMVQVDSGDNGG